MKEKERKSEETTKMHKRKTAQCELNFCNTFTQILYLYAKKCLCVSLIYHIVWQQSKQKPNILHTKYICCTHIFNCILNNWITFALFQFATHKTRNLSELKKKTPILSRRIVSLSRNWLQCICHGYECPLQMENIPVIYYIALHWVSNSIRGIRIMHVMHTTLSPTQMHSNSAYWNFIPTLQFDNNKFRKLLITKIIGEAKRYTYMASMLPFISVTSVYFG